MDSRARSLVSVVTSVYDGRGDARPVIESVFAQTYRNVEYVLVDN
jgi:glycosyltransferase involved in cell wall biosynthesis